MTNLSQLKKNNNNQIKCEKSPKKRPFATNCVSQRLIFHACLFHLKIKGMSHFNIERIQAPISVALKALSLSFSLSGCSDLSHNPTDMLTLTTLMHSDRDEAQHFYIVFFF